jgi:hypothetical protein
MTGWAALIIGHPQDLRQPDTVVFGDVREVFYL